MIILEWTGVLLLAAVFFEKNTFLVSVLPCHAANLNLSEKTLNSDFQDEF